VPHRRPNIVFILADDLGWGDLSCYGRPDYRTPYIDRLAEEGVRLTDCYSGSATCSPTRISLMTGRYPARHPAGLPEPILPRLHGFDLGLEPDFPSLPRLLSAAGYRTGLFGKWHCGEPPAFGPLKSGFDEYFGLSGSGAGYFTYKDEDGRYLARDGEEVAARSGYLTHVLTDKACAFIERHRDGPFYLSLHYTAPHWPWEAPYQEEAHEEAITTTGGGSLEIFAAMMKALDDGVGKVLDTLARLKLDGNTLVVFTSDNGGERYSYHYPLTGYIRLLREGGIRVPGIARWPGRIPARQVSSQMSITMDWTATFLALAGACADPRFPPDGEDLLPVLAGERSAYERIFFWRTAQADAVRRGPWKYFRNHGTGREYLFNLVKDVREYSNFRETYGPIFEELKSAFAQWEGGVLPRPEPIKPVPIPNLEFEIY
jgi:arylsulfatase A-like enzyme